MTLTVGLAQMALKKGAVADNLADLKTWAHRAAARDVDLLLVPELWASGYDLENSSEYARRAGTGIFKEMKNLADELGIMIGGSLLEEAEGRIYNTFSLYGKGQEVYYRKIHLFRLLEEEKWLHGGERLVAAHIQGHKIGLAVCYDLRFPEMFRAYAAAGVEMILLVAEWPQRRIIHWRKLLPARAIENQLYVAAVNKVGSSQGEALGGRSAVIDPWGEVLVEGQQEEELLTAVIDFTEVEKARRWIPVLEDRNPRAYQDLEES